MKEITDQIESIKNELESIKRRNKRVEADKAWETSKTRIVFIATTTYVLIFAFLMIIDDSNPVLHAFIPAVGYLLSTATYGVLKNWWLRRYKK